MQCMQQIGLCWVSSFVELAVELNSMAFVAIECSKHIRSLM